MPKNPSALQTGYFFGGAPCFCEVGLPPETGDMLERHIAAELPDRPVIVFRVLRNPAKAKTACHDVMAGGLRM